MDAHTPVELKENPWAVPPDESGWDMTSVPHRDKSKSQSHHDDPQNGRILFWLGGLEAAEKGEQLPRMEDFLEEQDKVQQAWHDDTGGWGDVDAGWRVAANDCLQAHADQVAPDGVENNRPIEQSPAPSKGPRANPWRRKRSRSYQLSAPKDAASPVWAPDTDAPLPVEPHAAKRPPARTQGRRRQEAKQSRPQVSWSVRPSRAVCPPLIYL
jgi:hypothetical protein